MPVSQHYDALICDLGDVFLFWSAETDTSITSKQLISMMKSSIWNDYECGLFSEEQCYLKLSAVFNFELEEVRRTFHQARQSIHPDYECVSLVRRIKEESQGRLRVFAMTNMSMGEFSFLKEELVSWGIFEDIFASCEVGARKPDQEFYQHVLDTVKVSPHRTVFIDDKLPNVEAARSFGMYGVVFDNLTRVRGELLTLLANTMQQVKNYTTIDVPGPLVRASPVQHIQYDSALTSNGNRMHKSDFLPGRTLLHSLQFPLLKAFDVAASGRITFVPSLEAILEIVSKSTDTQFCVLYKQPGDEGCPNPDVWSLAYVYGQSISSLQAADALISRTPPIHIYIYIKQQPNQESPRTFLFHARRVLRNSPRQQFEGDGHATTLQIHSTQDVILMPEEGGPEIDPIRSRRIGKVMKQRGSRVHMAQATVIGGMPSEHA